MSVFEQPLKSPFSIQDVTAGIGGAIGVTGGTVLGTPVGGVAAGVGGAALGGALGESIEQVIARITNDPNAPQSSREAAKRIAIEAAFEGGTELTGHGIGKVIQKVFRPFGTAIKKGATEAIESFKEFGGRFSAGQLSDNPIVQLFENIAEGSLLGAKKIIGFKQQQDEILDGMIMTLRESLGTPKGKSTIGEMAEDVISENSKMFRTEADVLYGQVDQLTKDAIVDFRGMKRLADSLKKEATLAGSLGGANDAIKMIDEVLKFPDYMTFKQASAIRSGLLDEKRALASQRNKAFGVASQLSKGADNVIKKGGSRLEGDAFLKWREANKFWRDGKAVFDDRYITALSKLDPDQVGKSVFANGRSARVRKLKRILDVKTFNDIRAGWLSEALNKSVSRESGDFVGKNFKGHIDALGKESFELMYSSLERKSIMSVVNVAQMIQRKNAVGSTGKMLIQLAQGSAAGTLFFQGFEKGAAAVIVAPYLMAKIAASPAGAKWLTTGMQIPPGSAQAFAMTERLFEFADKFGLRDMIEFTSTDEIIPTTPPVKPTHP